MATTAMTAAPPELTANGKHGNRQPVPYVQSLTMTSCKHEPDTYSNFAVKIDVPGRAEGLTVATPNGAHRMRVEVRAGGVTAVVIDCRVDGKGELVVEVQEIEAGAPEQLARLHLTRAAARRTNPNSTWRQNRRSTRALALRPGQEPGFSIPRRLSNFERVRFCARAQNRNFVATRVMWPERARCAKTDVQGE